MCCIFTCCGWMLDLIQRCWIFFMSCCISSAVCCVLLTASTSGIALGYNYSLAEYIDLKETNISVYIKRGVFDDDIADDMAWRRSGAGKGNSVDQSEPELENNMRRSEPKSEDNGDTTIRSGRRLDDSLYESDTQNKYEGSLMRLTAKGPFHPSPPYVPPTDPVTESNYKASPRIEDLVAENPPGQLDRLKAIQTLINARRAALRTPDPPDGRRNFGAAAPDMREREYKFLEQYPGFPGSGGGRRLMKEGDVIEPHPTPSNPYREAVPPQGFNNYLANPITSFPNPKINSFFQNPADYDKGDPLTFPPMPPTIRPSPVRPPRPSVTKQRIVVADRQPMTRTGHTKATAKDSRGFKDDLDKYKQSLLINQYDGPSFKVNEFEKMRPEGDDYEESFKGRPVRRKRSAQIISEEHKPYTVISDIDIVTSKSSDPVTNDANTDVFKQTATSVKSEHKYSTLIIKIKRNNARAKLIKQSRKQKGNKNKKRRKIRPTSKMRQSETRVRRKGKKRRGEKKPVTIDKNIDKFTRGMSNFINKLTPVTIPLDVLGDQKNKMETTVQETPFTLSLNRLLVS